MPRPYPLVKLFTHGRRLTVEEEGRGSGRLSEVLVARKVRPIIRSGRTRSTNAERADHTPDRLIRENGVGA